MSGEGVIQLTPLYGANDTDAMCYLLEIDDCRIMLDCGWDERFDERHLEALATAINDVDCVLVSHADISHLGALPYAIGQLGLDCPIYSTQPVWRMGSMFMYDAWQRLTARAEFDLFSIDDVDSAFDKFKTVTYAQECHLTGRGDGIVVTPFQAGHSLGGAIWRIVKDTEQIVYAVDLNHSRERHLDGTVLEISCPRPSVLITDAYNGLTVMTTKRNERDAQLFDAIRACLDGGGNCLMPVDTAGRVLELLVLLHSKWVSARLDQSYTIAFASHVAQNTLDFARTYVEWMSEKCQKQFDQMRENPFDLKHVVICQSLEEVLALRQPALVLASSLFMEMSFAEDLFIQWASDPKNLVGRDVMMTTAPRVPCLATTLLQKPTPKSVQIVRRYRVPLEGAELREYEEKRKEQEASVAKEESESESDEEDAEEDDGMARPGGAVGQATAMFKRGLKLTPSFPMYGFKEVVRSSDIYGEAIDFSEYAPPETNPDGISANPSGAAESASALLESATTIPAVPTKALTEHLTVGVRCAVHFVDFEGRMDQSSIKTVIKRVLPRKAVLVHGSAQAKDHIQEFLERELPNTSSVLIPDNQLSSVINSETNVFNVKIRDSLNKSLRFVQVGDYEVAYVDGRIVKSDDSRNRYPTLEQVAATAVPDRPAVYLGGSRMADLKKAIARAGIDAEFINGILVCAGGLVNIRKVTDHQVSVQGALCSQYFDIRRILYDQYQIL
ncbi:hypothetical protein PBRA_006130 [Plasmodiophora brassicae]|uniref:Cleavage and polyadenylation specificity factor subunit 2 n=1 Tax=Plasmodiophora brassicae TaxID=37360 RepID=A0A0G4ISA9_PLABS|nr:hypothetical protein PBRA_006130 [Plasmodiophora brassicae]